MIRPRRRTAARGPARALAGLLALTAGLAERSAAASPLSQQRSDFREAEQALEREDRERFEALLAKLRDYPLYPYLVYLDLKQRLDTVPTSAIQRFRERFAETPFAARLRHAWLRRLAEDKRWDEYLETYQRDGGTRYECLYRQALLHTGRPQAAIAGMNRLWLTGRSLPPSCDPLLDAWRAQGHLNSDLVWQRIRLALEAGQRGLTRYLRRFLPADERHWVTLWARGTRDAKQLLGRGLPPQGHPAVEWIWWPAVQHLARIAPAEAARYWPELQGHFGFSDQQAAELRRRIALQLAYRRRPEAGAWLNALAAQQDATIGQWRVRAALTRRNWEAARQAIEELEGRERDRPRWRYWWARSLEALGRHHEAAAVYHALADSRSYEGFLAADRLGRPYSFEHRELEIPTDEMQRVAGLPAIRRARELLYHEHGLEARREWYHATRNMDETQLRAAAKLFQEWEWHDRAILTLGRSRYRDDLELRFPVVYQDVVLNWARARDIEPAWAYAIMRRESAFNREARSHRGAVGLMQLLPGTARQMARQLNLESARTHELYRAETNIRLGTAYLRQVLDRFERHPVLATAAYNAGAARVRGWLPKDGALPADIWIETVPFQETRNYLRSVFAYTAIYEQRLGRQATPLSRRMPPVRPLRQREISDSGASASAG